MEKDKILLINACVRDISRTKLITDHIIESLDGDLEEVILENINFPIVNQEFLDKRYKDVDDENYENEIYNLAKQFANADILIFAAPYWDLSFPSMLKSYIEQICVLGITFYYDDKDMPQSLCKAKKMIYVTTAGGPIVNHNLGYGYIKEVCNTFFHVKEFEYIKAECLDLIGNNSEEIINKCIKDYDKAHKIN